MTNKEIKHFKSLKRMFEAAETSEDYSMPVAYLDYFGYLILKDELEKTNRIIKRHEKLEEYEVAAELLKSAKQIQEHIKEIEEENDFNKINM